jgi:hypothetical protein
VLAGVAVKVVPGIIRALTEFLRRNQVERIQYGDFVIDKPRPQDVDARTTCKSISSSSMMMFGIPA